MIFLAAIMGAAVFCGPAPTAYFDGSRIVLDHATCASVRSAPKDDGFADMAVFVLAHEEGHAHDSDIFLRSDCNRRGACEGFADCWAAQHYVAVAQAVGFGRKRALSFRRSMRTTLRGGGDSYGAIPARCWR